MQTKYKTMLAGMTKKRVGRPKKTAKDPWYLYILKCIDGSFYTGVTKDLDRRIKMHNNGTASRYTRSRRPVHLIYQEQCIGRAMALTRECAVKSLPKKKKMDLVKMKGL